MGGKAWKFYFMSLNWAFTLLICYSNCWPGECCLLFIRTIPLCSPSLDGRGGLSSCCKGWERSISSYLFISDNTRNCLSLQSAYEPHPGKVVWCGVGCPCIRYDAIGGKFLSQIIHYMLSWLPSSAALTIVMVLGFLFSSRWGKMNFILKGVPFIKLHSWQFTHLCHLGEYIPAHSYLLVSEPAQPLITAP